jgi:hypothetical protein
MANKEQHRGNREKKKPKKNKETAPAKVSSFATTPVMRTDPGRKSK